MVKGCAAVVLSIQEAVVDVRERMDGDHVLHLERTERARARRRPDRLAGLREHVVREAVAWMVERSVANRVHDLERQAHDADEGGPTFDGIVSLPLKIVNPV